MTTSTKIGCAHCPDEFDTDEQVFEHVKIKHPEKLRRPAKTAKQGVLVNVILDKSGSMATEINDTIGGFNAYIAELKKAEDVDYQFSLTLFDTRIESRYVAVELARVQDLTFLNYVPGGGTALNDAVGITIRKVEADKPKVDKVITVIMTDGEENSSREWSTEGIRNLITQKEKEGNWSFIFLGAGPNAWDQGRSYGIAATSNAQVDQNRYRETYAAVACSVNNFSADPTMKMDADMLTRSPKSMRMAANLRREKDDWNHNSTNPPKQ